MSYGIDNIDVLQKAASCVDRILLGAKARGSAGAGATQYETSVNLMAAKARGLTIPRTMLATADEIVELGGLMSLTGTHVRTEWRLARKAQPTRNHTAIDPAQKG